MRRPRAFHFIGIVALAASTATPTNATVWYTDDDAPPGGDGTSWPTAFKYLQDALSAATSGDEIRVAAGTYRPDEDAGNPAGTGDRTASFLLINGVGLYGGYAGIGKPDPDARDITKYNTILSGDLDADDQFGGPGDGDCCTHHESPGCADPDCEAAVCGFSPACCGTGWSPRCAALAEWYCCRLCASNVNTCENSYHVVTGSGTDATAILDGFTLTGGNANGPWEDGLTNGAGMYNDSGSPTVVACTFDANSAAYHGGGMYSSGDSRTTLIHCTFSGNRSFGYGGGVACWFGQMTLIHCTFTGNLSFSTGGGMFDLGFGSTLTDCEFVRNWAERYGGGTCSWTGRSMFTRCTFAENASGEDAGGAGVGLEATLTNCIFRANVAGRDGGGILQEEGNPALVNCPFVGNSAGRYGGGIMNWDWSVKERARTDTAFGGVSARPDTRETNVAYQWGMKMTNCVLVANYAGALGGGMSNKLHWYPSAPSVVGSTFGERSAGMYTGMSDSSHSGPTLTNCIFWLNSDQGGAGQSAQIDTTFGAEPDISYSCVQGWTGGFRGPGNQGADPRFVRNPDDGGDGWGDDPDTPDVDEGANDDYGDLHLQSDSPSIDAGDNNAVPPDTADLDGDGNTWERTPTDLDGSPRFMDDPEVPDTGQGILAIVDMGAFEADGIETPVCYCGDIDGNGDVSLNDFVMFVRCFGLTAPSDQCSAEELACSDLDGDGEVTLADFVTFAGVFGQPATGSPPNCS